MGETGCLMAHSDGRFAVDVRAARAGVWGDQTVRVVGTVQLLTHGHTTKNHRGAAASPQTCRLKNSLPNSVATQRSCFSYLQFVIHRTAFVSGLSSMMNPFRFGI